MKWRYETFEAKIERLAKWHKWFAWYPVYIDGVAYWLESVLRKDEWHEAMSPYPYTWWTTEYKPLNKMER